MRSNRDKSNIAITKLEEQSNMRSNRDKSNIAITILETLQFDSALSIIL